MKLDKNATIHIIGIGGTGMSPIAVVLKEQGFNVRGSDQAESAMAERLRTMEIPVTVGQRAANVGGADLVLYSSAVHADNPEFAEAKRLRIPTQKRSEFLVDLLENRNVIAVAGTHGKTTTSSMIAWALSEIGTDPGFIIGSTPKNLGTNARNGRSADFVIEADEYDRMFHGLRPALAILTLVEPDHPDCFPTEAVYFDAFREFIRRCKPGATVLLQSGDPVQPEIVRSSGADVRVMRYGFEKDDDFRIENPRPTEDGGFAFEFVLAETGAREPVQLSVPGIHNVLNAAAALAAVALQGQDLTSAAAALSKFVGSERRFEKTAESDGIVIIDDYAHHPTEIRATLAAARDAFAERRIWALWQPHTFSRTQQLLKSFIHAFENADRILVAPIYASRETETDFGNCDLMKALRAVRPDAVFAETNENAVRLLTAGLTSGDVVVTLSAGDANQFGPMALRRRMEQLSSANVDELRARIVRGQPIAVISNLRVGGPAAETLIVRTIGELRTAVIDARNEGIPYKVVGGLSNILFPDSGFDGRLIVNQSDEIRLHETENGSVRVTAASGASLNDLVRITVDYHLSGLEWATRIPGSVGGAVYGNAGAYGSEIKDSLRSVTVLSPKNEVITLQKAEIPFVYRASAFKTGERTGTILSAEFELFPRDPDEIEAKSAEIWAKRDKFNFKNQGSLGSVFRNPSGDYAGRLITEAGLRNAVEGGAAVSDFHGNIFVTNPGATSADFLRLVNRVHDRILVDFGVDLRTEIEVFPPKGAESNEEGGTTA